MNKMDEMILVVKRETLFHYEEDHFQGYVKTEDMPKLENRLVDYEVSRRGDMEEDEEYKQLITYVLLQDKETGEYLYYKRLSKGGEKRLQGTLSIGVGGHTNAVPGIDTISELLHENALRELNEELILGEEVRIDHVGYVNNDLDAVGRVHIGLVYCAEVSSKSVVECGEPDTLSLDWASLDDLRNEDLLEDWSSIILHSTATGEKQSEGLKLIN